MRKSALCEFTKSTVFIKLFFSGFIGLFFASALVGVNPREAIQASLVITTQICTGAALWRIIKAPSKESIHELFGVGLAVGSSVAVLSHLVLLRTFIGRFSWIVPSVVLLIVISTIPSAKSKFQNTEITPLNPFVFDALILSTTVALSFWWWWTLPVVVVLIVLKHTFIYACNFKRYALMLLCGIAAIGILLIANYLKNLNDSWWLFSYDQIFSESMSISLTNWGPTDNIQHAGSNFSYHWFALAWSGITTQGAAVGSWVMITKILPICAMFGVVSMLWSISTRLSNSRLIPFLTVFSFSLLSNPFLLQPSRFINSPTFYFSLIWLLAFSLVFLDGIKQKGLYKFVFLILLYLSTIAGKVSSGAVIFGAVAFSLLCSIVFYRNNKKLIQYHLATFSVLVAATLFAYLFMFRSQTIGFRSGSGSESLYFDPFQLAPTLGVFNFESAITIRFISFLVVLVCFLPMISASFFFLLKPMLEGSVQFLYLAGLTFAGLFGVAVFNHDGGSQLYFLLASMTTAPILIARVAEVGFIKFRSLFSKKTLALVALSGVAIAITVEMYWQESIFGGQSQRQLSMGKVFLILTAFLTSLVVSRALSGAKRIRSEEIKRHQIFCWFVFMVFFSSSISHGVIQRVETTRDYGKKVEMDRTNPDLLTGSDAHVDALVWLRNNSEVNDIVAVNRFCIPGIDSCVSKWFLVTALTHRRALIEGGYFDATDPPDWASEKIRNSIEFAESPNTTNYRWLLKQNVSWVVVDHESQVSGLRNWEPYGVSAYSNDLVTIVRLNK
jgi:hypothetical protein